MDTLSSEKGTYALIMRLDQQCRIPVGKLGTFLFPEGWYVYTGSAFGPGGLKSRIHRHLKKKKKNHWHIDYLRNRCNIINVWISTSETRLECQWASKLYQSGNAIISVSGMGSSDCTCETHLFLFKKQPVTELIGRDPGTGINRIIYG